MQLFFSRERQEYYIFIPLEQVQTPGSVTFERDAMREFRDILVADIHTHGLYPAFWSSVDNADEKGWRFYIVVGNLDQDYPTVKARIGANGHFRDIPLPNEEGSMKYWR